MINKQSVQGIGLNLRLEYIDDILRELPELDCLQIIVENWFSDGPQHKKLEKLRSHYELSFHCLNMNLGSNEEPDINYLKKVKTLADTFQPKNISDHLCFQSLSGSYHHDLLPICFDEKTLQSTIRNINKIQDYFSRSILIENLSYYIEFKNSIYAEEEFLNQLIEKTSCSLLLDINNILINYKNLGISPDNYLKTIRLENVKEIHMAGSCTEGNILVDLHNHFPCDDSFHYLNKIDTKNALLFYERDQDLPSFETLINELDNIRSRFV